MRDVAEEARLAALHGHQILDTAHEPAFDALSRLAATLCRTPIALVSFVDHDRQWFKATVGLELVETPRATSFCTHALLADDDLLVVPDATCDARFRDNPFVLGAPDIRFYAGAVIRDDAGHALGTVCVIDTERRDPASVDLAALRALAGQAGALVDLHRSRTLLRHSERALAATGTTSRGVAAITTDADYRIIGWTGDAEQMYGWTAHEVMGRRVDQVLETSFFDSDAATAGSSLIDTGFWTGVVGQRRRDGSLLVLESSVRIVRDGDDLPGVVVAVNVDAGHVVDEHGQVRRPGPDHHRGGDPLTGLGTRAMMEAAFTRTPPGGATVVAIDLDRFRLVNQALGSSAANEVLTTVGSRIVAVVGDPSDVARIGGDQFAVVVRGDVAAARRVGARLLERIADPLLVSTGDRVVVTASLGCWPLDDQGIGAALTGAQSAAKRARRLGGNRWQDAVVQHSVDPRMGAALHRAVLADELHLVYQPQVRLRDGVVTGVEALLRWDDPELGSVPPEVFIPVAEDVGLVERLGSWVLQEACTAAAGWRLPETGRPPVVAVNVSTRQLGTASTLRQAAVDALASSGLPADRLCLEITESALADDTEAAVATLHQLWALGIRLSIDDFGTGFSSLSYLTQFPIDELKVDRSFVAQVGTDPRAAAIVRSVVALSKSLGVECVAEGVEDAEQLAFLRDLDCTSAQGFLLARPVLPAAVPALLAERSPTFLAAVAEPGRSAVSGSGGRRRGAPRR